MSLFQIYIFIFVCSNLSNKCCCIYLCKRFQQLKHVDNRTPRSDHSLDYQNEKFRQQFNHYHYRIKNTILLMMMTTSFEIDFWHSFFFFVYFFFFFVLVQWNGCAFNLKLILKYNSSLHESCIQRNEKRILINNHQETQESGKDEGWVSRSSTSNEAQSKPIGWGKKEIYLLVHCFVRWLISFSYVIAVHEILASRTTSHC